MSHRHFAQSNSRPPAPCKSRFAVRREELEKQEQLLLEKKKEVEAKLCHREPADSSSAATDLATAPPAPETPQSAATADHVVKCEAPGFANKFQNNGSFLELFRSMQKKNEDQDERDKKSTPSPLPEASVTSTCPEKSAKLEAIEQCATFVAMNGPTSEAVLRQRFDSSSDYTWLFDTISMDYKYYEHRVRELTSAKVEADVDDELEKDKVCGGSGQQDEVPPAKKRKHSRWGSASDILPLDADLMQYAVQVFGTVELEEHQWRQLQDQRNMRILTGLTRKRMKQASEVQYGYDSDEEVDGGTWEHKRRTEEMEKTKERAQCLTMLNAGKTHIGDFLPPDELSRFLRQWERVRAGKPAGSMTDNYEQFKITSENAGFKMIQRMGWKEGQTLGADSQSGISEPIQVESTSEHRGLGAAAPGQLKEGDDEFEAYRKRMMFAYRFRPNPLNNPRRTYY